MCTCISLKKYSKNKKNKHLKKIKEKTLKEQNFDLISIYSPFDLIKRLNL